MPRKRAGRFFVGDRACESLGSAIIYAQRLAEHWKGEPRSFYVRDALDVGLVRIDLDEDRIVRTHPA